MIAQSFSKSNSPGKFEPAEPQAARNSSDYRVGPGGDAGRELYLSESGSCRGKMPWGELGRRRWSQNWRGILGSSSKKRRTSSTPNFSMAMRSMPSPKAKRRRFPGRSRRPRRPWAGPCWSRDPRASWWPGRPAAVAAAHDDPRTTSATVRRRGELGGSGRPPRGRRSADEGGEDPLGRRSHPLITNRPSTWWNMGEWAMSESRRRPCPGR